jgi:hypothetical protein
MHFLKCKIRIEMQNYKKTLQTLQNYKKNVMLL